MTDQINLGTIPLAIFAVHYSEISEMSTKNIKIIMFLGSEARQVCRADNLVAICEPIV
jgi:hypothetical protein